MGYFLFLWSLFYSFTLYAKRFNHQLKKLEWEILHRKHKKCNVVRQALELSSSGLSLDMYTLGVDQLKYVACRLAFFHVNAASPVSEPCYPSVLYNFNSQAPINSFQSIYLIILFSLIPMLWKTGGQSLPIQCLVGLLVRCN